MGLAAVGGQLIGGVLIQADIAGLGWRSCFLINVPIGLVALIAAPGGSCPSRARSSGSRLDLIGTALLTAGLTAVVLPLVEGRQHGWPLWTWVSLGGRAADPDRASPPTSGAWPRRGGAAAARLRRCSAARAFSAGLLAQLAFWCGQASFFLVLALYLQQGRGLSALHAGPGVHDPRGRLPGRVARAPGARSPRHGRRLLAVGALVLAAGHAAAARCRRPTSASAARSRALVPGLLLVGAGHGPRDRAADDHDPGQRARRARRRRLGRADDDAERRQRARRGGDRRDLLRRAARRLRPRVRAEPGRAGGAAAGGGGSPAAPDAGAGCPADRVATVTSGNRAPPPR